MDPVRVLIVEDHQLVSEAMARALAGEPEMVIVGLASTVAEALDRLRITPVDVVLLDFRLPDGDGLVVARRILQDYPSTRVIMVTAEEQRDVIKAALQAGCTGFIGKSESFVHLPNAIRNAAAGTTAISPAIAAKLVDDAPPRPTGSTDDLTDREIEVLRLLANGLPSHEVAERLFMAPHTLRNYLNRINLKLDTHSKLEAVSRALRAGLITLDGPADQTGEGDGHRSQPIPR